MPSLLYKWQSEILKGEYGVQSEFKEIKKPKNFPTDTDIISFSRQIPYPIMWQKFCKFLLHTLGGWRVEMTVPHQDKCIICVAPHTSNWDFIIAELYYHSIGRRAGFLMKREWFFWPMGCLFRSLGGVPVERSRKTSLTDQLAERAQEAKDHFELAVTPEGTRSLTTQWKRGFYFIALKAGLPIQLYALDFPGKRIVCTKTLYPTGNVEADMREIMEYYRPYQGKYPGKFAVEEIPEVSSPAK